MTVAEIDCLDFTAFHERFRAAVRQHGGVVRPLSNGGFAGIWNPTAPRLAVMSGLHGDERSGPIALLQWLEAALPGSLVSASVPLWLAPLLNAHGWNRREREWNSHDLNGCFHPATPAPFLAEVMDDLRVCPPAFFLDLHEDSGWAEPYLFGYTEERHDLPERLAQELQCHLEPWTSFEAWAGCSEVFVRELGCTRCATVEASPNWPLEERVVWQQRALRWFVAQITAASATTAEAGTPAPR
jgi:hypothetical protein